MRNQQVRSELQPIRRLISKVVKRNKAVITVLMNTAEIRSPERRKTARGTLLICAFLVMLSLTSVGFLGRLDAAPNRKPNVILIMTDDQGYGDLACHGNPYIETPHLDKLHAESVRLTDFHVSPFCAPTRASLMTGRFAARTDVWTTVFNRNHLNRDETTMAEYFKSSGYHTGQFGKWHLGHNYPYRPMDRGFDCWVGHGDGGTGTASDYWGNDKMNDTYTRNGKYESFKGFSTDIYFDETMKFIRKCDQKKEPFFVYLATNVPHGPWNVIKKWREPYKAKADEKLTENYFDFFATISRFDENMGRLREFLKEQKLSENTILIFLTDNGSSGGSTLYNAGMSGKKGSTLDGGHRVPCFIHWPQADLDKGRDMDVLTSNTDLLPTLIDLCDLNMPKKKLLPLDGKSLSPALRGKNLNWDDRTIFLHSQNVSKQSVKWKNGVVLTQRWRLLGKGRLYDIKADPMQKKNVAAQHPEVVTNLSNRYDRYWESLKQDEVKPARSIIGSPKQHETSLVPDGWIKENKTASSWNQNHVLNGVLAMGYWPIEVSKKGRYHFDIRRWPKELDVPISAELPAALEGDITKNGKLVRRGRGKAIPAVKVRLKVGETTAEKIIGKQDTFVRFSLDLPQGETQVQAWLIDKNGKEYGAFYVYVIPEKD